MVAPISEHSSNSEDAKGIEPKFFPEAIITETPNVFKRVGGQTFETESLESFYKPIDSYEGRHRFDPDFEWEPKEEQQVVRKVGHVRCCISRKQLSD